MTGPDPRAGYVLPVVLVTVGVLALVFASAASAVTALGTRARASADTAAFSSAALSAEAQATFLAATRRFDADGLASDGPPPPPGAAAPHAAVRLDGRAYAWAPDPALRLRLQDEAGLVNLDRSRPDALLRLFARLGLSAAEAETLRDRLLDAVEGARTRRPRGAVAADYVAAGLPPPRAGGFDGLAEVAGVRGWPELMGGARTGALQAWATAVPGSSAFNVNTAPVTVLAVVLNLDEPEATRLVARREAASIGSLAQLGLPPSPAGSAEPVRPGGRVRLTVEDARRGLRYTSRLAPLDAADGPPWAAAGGATLRTDPDPAPPDAPRLPDPAGPAAPL